jgi:hypothetical protein
MSLADGGTSGIPGSVPFIELAGHNFICNPLLA